jgi:hypothetical protein
MWLNIGVVIVLVLKNSDVALKKNRLFAAQCHSTSHL